MSSSFYFIYFFHSEINLQKAWQTSRGPKPLGWHSKLGLLRDPTLAVVFAFDAAQDALVLPKVQG